MELNFEMRDILDILISLYITILFGYFVRCIQELLVLKAKDM